MEIDGAALVANWRMMAAQSQPAQCAAVIKADAYGLGAGQVISRLAAAGCRHFFVARWAEAEALRPWPAEFMLAVLHGASVEDMVEMREAGVLPVLNSRAQTLAWHATGGGPCMAMIDTGMNRLGLTAGELMTGALDALDVRCLLSHLACADDDESQANEQQRARFVELAARYPGVPRSLANSAGIALGKSYHFELTRPGIALYGGASHPRLDDAVQPVVRVIAQVLQRRTLAPGDSVGYGGTFVAGEETEIAIIDCGYADGYGLNFSGCGLARRGAAILPIAGRVSMDTLAIVVDTAISLDEGDEVELVIDLVRLARSQGGSPYEWLTRIAPNCRRTWLD